MRYAVALALMAAMPPAAVGADDKPACKLETIGTATVRAVVDGRTVALADGREVRLLGIEVPEHGAGNALLAAELAGREVNLLRLGPDRDRYGRTVAFVAPRPGSAPGIAGSVQKSLLMQGHARVAAKIGDMACAAELLATERQARAAGLGLWADPHYVLAKAEDPAGILAVRGRFAVVEGKVLSVRESGAQFYVNFGRRWSDDFTVTILKRNAPTFAAAGLELKKLTGQRVRIRGTVEERGGPWIEATRPEQIEIAERP